MATKTTTTAIALSCLLRSLKAGKKCNPKDLEALRITLDQQADLQSFDDQLSVSKLTEPARFPNTQQMNRIFEAFKSAKAHVLEYPKVAPGTQDLVARHSIGILEECGLTLQVMYDRSRDRLELPVGRHRYALPNLPRPISYHAEYTLDGVKICTAYLPQLRGEAGCDVHAHEMFCLLATAIRSRQESPKRKSYRVSTLA
jgi:hypothetical protein